jgi:4-hydroxy-2-oxoheptanedioate aldolase
MLNFDRITCLKGEFEAEALPRDTLAAEVIFATRHGVDYLVKIGGCEAKADIRFLHQIGVRQVVAPMIESGFAMQKYMGMLPEDAFDHIGVTVETRNAVERIEELLDAGTKLTEVTVGRSDLTASFGGQGVECDQTIDMVKRVARAAAKRGLPTTMGGTISAETRALLEQDRELRDLVAAVETRKCVMHTERFLEDGALADAFAVENALLELQSHYHGAIASAADERLVQIRARM